MNFKACLCSHFPRFKAKILQRPRKLEAGLCASKHFFVSIRPVSHWFMEYKAIAGHHAVVVFLGLLVYYFSVGLYACSLELMEETTILAAKMLSMLELRYGL